MYLAMTMRTEHHAFPGFDQNLRPRLHLLGNPKFLFRRVKMVKIIDNVVIAETAAGTL